MEWLLSSFSAIVFYGIAAVAVAGAIGVIWFKSPVHAALSLLMTFLAVAGLFVLANAEFIAAVQVLVYAGGVMVLFLFVIMLVNVRTLPREPQYIGKIAPAAVVLSSLMVVILGLALWAGWHSAPAGGEALFTVEGSLMGNTEAVGWVLYRQFLLPFEVVSVILLVAMVGAIVLGRKGHEGRNDA